MRQEEDQGKETATTAEDLISVGYRTYPLMAVGYEYAYTQFIFIFYPV